MATFIINKPIGKDIFIRRIDNSRIVYPILLSFRFFLSLHTFNLKIWFHFYLHRSYFSLNFIFSISYGSASIKIAQRKIRAHEIEKKIQRNDNFRSRNIDFFSLHCHCIWILSALWWACLKHNKQHQAPVTFCIDNFFLFALPSPI